MNKSLEQQILDNAPEGATHVLIDHEYNPTYVKYLPEKLVYFWYWPSNGNWFEYGSMPTNEMRSLSDIQQIIALQNENAEKDKRIAELDRKLLQYQDDYFGCAE